MGKTKDEVIVTEHKIDNRHLTYLMTKSMPFFNN